MQYGTFDNDRYEYVITDAHTPAPWVNYLGSTEYGAIVSNNAGGYSFVKSGANGRILRYHFNGSDTPGRYIYLRNRKKGHQRLLTRFPDVCRHGTGYTVMEAEFEGIKAEITFYVPEGGRHEVWAVRLKNSSGDKASFSVTGYAELTNNSNYEQDTVNLQYSQFITRTEFKGNRIRQMLHANLDGTSLATEHSLEERMFALCGAKISSYCGDRTEFLGVWGDYTDPEGLKDGKLPGTLNYGENSCGALMTDIDLKPGEETFLAFLLAQADNSEAEKICAGYEKDCAKVCERELEEIRRVRHGIFSNLQVRTPSPEFNTMVNIWNAYNCMITFDWSRAASFFYCGLRNGYGYRDTVQDIQGIIHLEPEKARERIDFMLSAQAANGGGLPLVKFTHTPGKEDTPDEESYRQETGHPAWRADDALWLFPTVHKYICETGNTGYLDREILFADKESGTVYEHLKRALQFTKERQGKHGMPAGLHADWNDCLRLGAKGESVFVAFQYYLALKIMSGYAELKKDTEYFRLLEQEKDRMEQVLETECYDGDRYIRGFAEDGEVIGAAAAPEANLWLNPQSWSVISGMPDEEKGKTALDNVLKTLNTEYGAMLMMPPFKDKAFDGAISIIYNPGMKENSAVFSQSQGWLILAEALLGRGDRAFLYYMENCPANQNDRAEIRVMEPYVYGQFTEGQMSPHRGRSHVHWLTGTASTMMVASVEGILGIRPDVSGLLLKPAFPAEWDRVEIRKKFRGKDLKITVLNPGHAESGFVSMRVNGKEVPEPYVPEEMMTEKTEIELKIS